MQKLWTSECFFVFADIGGKDKVYILLFMMPYAAMELEGVLNRVKQNGKHFAKVL